MTSIISAMPMPAPVPPRRHVRSRRRRAIARYRILDSAAEADFRAVIGLGNSLGVQTVAEGIETQMQADFVTAHGCDVGQGFLFSAAQPAHSVPALIDRFQTREAA